MNPGAETIERLSHIDGLDAEVDREVSRDDDQ